jgi:dolichyl-diphosphooligosaccharide--protein glycosyltransferase
MPQAVRQLPRLGSFASWLLLFAVAIAVRALRFGLVFTASGVRFPHGADELYHLRRIWFSVVNFPASLPFDSYMNYPIGAKPVWPPLFDWSIAAVARALTGPADQGAVEVVAAWAPPVIGAVAVVAAAWLARRSFSPAAGWVTGALLAVQPAHVFYSQLGEVDHHVAVGLLVLLLIGAAMRVAGPVATSTPRAAVTCGVAAAAAILLWPGSLLYVAVVQAFLVLQLLATREQATARARAHVLAALHATAMAVLLPFCAGRSWEQFGAVSALVLSNFQPLWFGAGALVLWLVGWLWSRPALGADRARRFGLALGLAALGLAAAWLAVPALAESLSNAASWFEADPFLGVISEMQPLLFSGGPFDPGLAHHQFSYLFWVYPFAAVWLVGQAIRGRRGEVGLLLSWSAVACALALLQGRFTDVAGPAFALVLGHALVELVRAARQRFPSRRAVPIAVSLLCFAAAVSPYADSYRGDLAASLAARRGEPLQYTRHVRERRVLERVGRWLKQNTPEVEGYLDPTLRPAYGVLSAWGHGHQLRYQAERPMVEDNFGPYAGGVGFAQARAYYASRDEEAGAAIADRLGARYVVAAPQGSGQSPPLRGSLATRLALLPGVPMPALTRHRLVFVADDSDLAREPGRRPWSLAVYEVVRGALVVGRATGASRVSFELWFPLGTSPALRYKATATVGATGEYEIRLPHPSATGYVVRSGSHRGSLVLSEADVREGRTVSGPSFGR